MIGRLVAAIGRHAGRSLALIAVVVAALGGAAAAFGGSFVDDFSVPGSGSQQSLDFLREEFPDAAGDGATVVFTALDGEIADPDVTEQVQNTVTELEGLDGVSGVVSPFTPQIGEAQVSEDGRIAYATVQYDGTVGELGDAATDLTDVVEAAGTPQLEVAANGAILQAPDLGGLPVAEIIGLGVALIILIALFRRPRPVVATLVSALVGVGVSVLLLVLGASVVNMPSYALTLAAMLGLGAGIDYALLFTDRFRHEVSGGVPRQRALAVAGRSAGVTVVAAGLIVVVALVCLALVGLPLVTWMGVGAAVAVVFVVVAAITVLPALLGLGRDGSRHAAGHDVATTTGRPDSSAHETGVFGRWAAFLGRAPIIPIVIGVGLMVLMALPVGGLRLGQPDDSNLAEGATQRVAFERLAEGFGVGFNGPILLSIDLPDPGPDAVSPAEGAPPLNPAALPVLQSMLTTLPETPGVAQVGTPLPSPDGGAMILQVIPESSPQSAETSDLVQSLRDDVLPGITEGTDVQAYVGGATATFDDLGGRVTDRLPLFIGVVVALAIVLLMAVFRSIWVPLVSAVFNGLSTLAAYGAVVFVFQEGNGSALFGVDGPVPTVAFVPLFMFALLFGLSMDYNVFLQTRIAEEHRHGSPARLAVVRGVGSTGRVIAAAGAIMVAVFGAFAFHHNVIIAEIGFGLAVAILIDVLLVRFLLAPAVMHLLGEHAWWFPRWLDRILPTVSLEGHEPEPATGSATPASADTPSEART